MVYNSKKKGIGSEILSVPFFSKIREGRADFFGFLFVSVF